MENLKLLVKRHKHNKRQGPGSDEITRLAILHTGLAEKRGLKIADIGCGTGAQTIILAQTLDGKITAVDLFPEFLEKVETNAQNAGLEQRIETLQCSMDALPFKQESLDLIWSEGAIYIMGFEKGIQYWYSFLKPGGYLAVSDAVWLMEKRPPEIETYWNEEYREIETMASKAEKLKASGYNPVAQLILPQECWMDNYYLTLRQTMEEFLIRHDNSPAAKELLEMEAQEIKIYETYKEYYSYGFFIARKI
jgi:ubiquinone/menaquinone biosynthesis C-methylase UbiE